MNALHKDEGHGTTHREMLMQSMELPAKSIRAARYVPRLTFWGSHREAIITVIVVILAFLLLWGNIRLFAVSL